MVALLNLSSWCLVMVEWLFLAVPRGCLRFVIVVFRDHTHYFCHMLSKWSQLNGSMCLSCGRQVRLRLGLGVSVSNLALVGLIVYQGS